MTTQTSALIPADEWGVSFSVKQCRNFGLEQGDALDWLINHAGFRRFRLMSYWDEHEREPGIYDFSLLDEQVDTIEQAGGVISMCLGARQPRWPENHWPEWAWEAPKQHRTDALLNYIQVVMERYKDRSSIISWQLENEALLDTFGKHSEVDRKRLRQEYVLVKQLDPIRPCIMTTSTSWGIPLRRPIPDIIGFSFYQIVYNNGSYSTSFHNPLLDRIRAALIRLIWRKPSFIHELQCEPWGPTNVWKMPTSEQDKSMSPAQITKNIQLAKQTNLHPVDLWGGEWWFWRLQQDTSDTTWSAVHVAITTDSPKE
jgi:hypothetical protein